MDAFTGFLVGWFFCIFGRFGVLFVSFLLSHWLGFTFWVDFLVVLQNGYAIFAPFVALRLIFSVDFWLLDVVLVCFGRFLSIL